MGDSPFFLYNTLYSMKRATPFTVYVLLLNQIHRFLILGLGKEKNNSYLSDEKLQMQSSQVNVIPYTFTVLHKLMYMFLLQMQ